MTERDAAEGANEASRSIAGDSYSRFADRVNETWARAAHALGRGYRNSRLGTLTDRLNAAAEHSRVVNWLTKEPEPTVITIDLRETWTIGPLLAGLDWLVAALEEPYENSRTRALGHRLHGAAGTYAIPAISGVVLGLASGTLALGIVPVTPASLLVLGAVTVAALAGLLLDRPEVAFQESRIGSALVRAILGPESHERRD